MRSWNAGKRSSWNRVAAPCGACPREAGQSRGEARRVSPRSCRVRIDPRCHARIGPGTNQFGRDVFLKEKTAHPRYAGRLVDGLRLKSRSSAKPLMASKTSRRLFVPAVCPASPPVSRSCSREIASCTASSAVAKRPLRTCYWMNDSWSEVRRTSRVRV